MKAELQTLVALQGGELELLRIEEETARINETRRALQAELEAARQMVSRAEEKSEAARGEARRLDVELKTAEDQVGKFKDHLLSVKTNKELWALQEEIAQAEAAVGGVETKILEQLEAADSLDGVIDERRRNLAATSERVDAANAEADGAQAELEAERAKVLDSIDELRGRLSSDLLAVYEAVKKSRGGVGVAEALDETCMVCNFRMRPQLYVEVFNLAEIIRCENCHRILYVAERLDLPGRNPIPEALDPADTVVASSNAGADAAP